MSWSSPRTSAADRPDRPTDSAQQQPQPRPPAADPERSQEESEARARRTIRRYCKSLGIDRLGTLTYRCRRCNRPAGCVCPEGPDRPRWDERANVFADIEAFRRAVRDAYGSTPMVVVIEQHEDGHLHIHFGFARYFDAKKFRSCWPHGWIDLRRLKSKVAAEGGRQSARVEASKVAAYLAKYVTKQHGHTPGKKSYSTTRGMVPPPRRTRFMSEAEAYRWLEDVMGLPSYVWCSDVRDDWEGPPIRMLFYDDDDG